jgi:hypothetical protein
MKLTQPQLMLLGDLVRNGKDHCFEGYKPAQKLIQLGLAKARKGSFGSLHLEPTEAGRAALTGKPNTP